MGTVDPVDLVDSAGIVEAAGSVGTAGTVDAVDTAGTVDAAGAVSAGGSVDAGGTVDGVDTVDVLVQRLDERLPLPGYAQPGDAGADLVAARDVTLAPGERCLVPTGVAIALPAGYVGLVHPRSGLAARLGVTVLNAPGTVDAGYRGEILVNLVNHDPTRTARLHRGDRIAQLVVQRVERARFRPVGQLPESVRGAGGHGSTGGFTPADRSAPPTGPDRRDDAGESVTMHGCGEVAE